MSWVDGAIHAVLDKEGCGCSDSIHSETTSCSQEQLAAASSPANLTPRHHLIPFRNEFSISHEAHTIETAILGTKLPQVFSPSIEDERQ